MRTKCPRGLSEGSGLGSGSQEFREFLSEVLSKGLEIFEAIEKFLESSIVFISFIVENAVDQATQLEVCNGEAFSYDEFVGGVVGKSLVNGT